MFLKSKPKEMVQFMETKRQLMETMATKEMVLIKLNQSGNLRSIHNLNFPNLQNNGKSIF